jgi:phosphatidylglycerophosphate synthase
MQYLPHHFFIIILPIIKMVFLTKEALENLKVYKYHGTPLTPLCRLLNWLLWEPIAKWLPSWLAPNTITIISSLSMIISIGLLCYQADVDLKSQPSTGYLALALFGYWFYDLLDCLDGKQARNLKVSSPLGQLLDHGLDGSVNVFTTAMINIIFSGNFHTWEPFFVTFAIMTLHFYAAWTEKKCGIMRTSFGGFGVHEFTHFNYLHIVLTMVYGYEFWDYELFGFKLRFLHCVYLSITYVTLLPMYLYENLVIVGISSFATIFPMLQMYLAGWLLYSSEVYKGCLIFVLLSIGSIIGVMNVDHTVRNTTKEDFNYLRADSTLFLMASIGIYYFRSHVLAVDAVYGLFVVSFVYFWVFTIGVTLTISRFLDIPLFSVKKPKTS